MTCVSGDVGWMTRCAHLVFIAACIVTTTAWASERQQQEQEYAEYAVGPLDVLDVRIFDQPDLSGTYHVAIDGSVSFPLIGRISVGHQTLRQIEDVLRERLADGYLRNPRVNVTVTEYRSRRVFVLGEVRRPGAYPLTAPMTVVELLALAGGHTELASSDAVVVRAAALAPVVVPPPDGLGPAMERLNLDALGRGDLAENVILRHGDTLFVARAEEVYVFGEVRSPGRYVIGDDTTVQEALSLAGGNTDVAALNRVRILRTLGDEQVEIDAQLSDRVRPGDMVVARTEEVYVFGEVRSPGRYALRKDTNVIQVLSLAGGGTIFAALNRVRILRTLGDEQVEMDAQLSDRVQPGDVVWVPNRFF